MSNYSENSYLAHQEHFKQDLVDQQRLDIGASWFREDTANYWVHSRMYEGAVHLQLDPDKAWVTVGDGRYGLDSIILKRKGWRNVLPTDISGYLLEASLKKGLINEYKVENAEKLSFSTEQFNYVFCKESYHHFPRPMVALYEMLRVAKEAVLLIEPNDTVNSNSLHAKLRRLKRALKKHWFILKVKFHNRCNKNKIQQILKEYEQKQHIDAGRYEDSTNYIYTISKRELEKVCLGLNYPVIAFKGLNDSYQPGCEFEIASWKNKMYRKMRVKCWINNILCRLKIKDYSMLMAIIFKTLPDNEILTRLRKNEWQVIYLPLNPYIQR